VSGCYGFVVWCVVFVVLFDGFLGFDKVLVLFGLLGVMFFGSVLVRFVLVLGGFLVLVGGFMGCVDVLVV